MPLVEWFYLQLHSECGGTLPSRTSRQSPEWFRLLDEMDTLWRPAMVVLRLKRMGRTHRPFYRLNAMDKRAPRDGRVIEELGWFDPLAPEDKQLSIKVDRVDYWLSVGAQPSRTVKTLLRRVDCDPTSGKKLQA